MRHEVQISSRVDLTTEEVERAIALEGPGGPVFRSGGTVCRVTSDGLIEPWPKEALRVYLSSVCDFLSGERKVAPPTWVAQAVLERGSDLLPNLRGVTRIPAFRHPCDLVCQGYDEVSELFIRGPEGIKIDPTRTTSELLDVVLDPWDEIPFVSPEDKATLIAAALTLVRRHDIRGPVPIFGITAPKRGQGTGKSLTVELLTAAALGANPEVLLPLKDETEMRKRLLALAMKSPEVIQLDNVVDRIDSPSLAAAITGERILDRVLGSTKIVSAQMLSVWFLTGNAMELDGDILRRGLVVRLDAGTPYPERRSFRRRRDELLAATRANRSKWLSAALTLIDRFEEHGAPQHDNNPWGSFEAWDKSVRSMVVWLGLPDPVRTPTKDANMEFLAETWKKNFQGPVTSIQVHDRLKHLIPPPANETPKSVGRWLSGIPWVSSVGRRAEGILWEIREG